MMRWVIASVVILLAIILLGPALMALGRKLVGYFRESSKYLEQEKEDDTSSIQQDKDS